MLQKKSFRLYYSTDTVESEVFEYLKKHGFETNLQSCLTNFFLPHARLKYQNYYKNELFESSLFNLEKLTESHSQKQQKCLNSLKKNLLIESCTKKVLNTSRKQKSILINIQFRQGSNTEEVWNYFQNSFTSKEIVTIVKNFAVKWYLFFARYENKKYYSFLELDSTYNLWNDWIANEIANLKNYQVVIGLKENDIDENNYIEVAKTQENKKFGISSISGF